MLKLPAGFRYLEIGEIVRSTDLINADKNYIWVPYSEIGCDESIGRPVEACHYEICRKYITPGGNVLDEDLC